MSPEIKLKISQTLKRKGIKPIFRYDSTGKKHKKSWFIKMHNTISKRWPGIMIQCPCGIVFKVSPKRKETAKFCSHKCQSNSFKKSIEHKKEVRNKNKQISESKRRSLKKIVFCDLTLNDWEEIKKKYNYTCPCCHKKEPQIRLTIDHIIPLKFKGNHTRNNIQPLCKSCNSKKGIKVISFPVFMKTDT